VTWEAVRRQGWSGEAAGVAWGGLAKWGKMNKSPLLIAATFLTKFCNSITRQWPEQRGVQTITDSARHLVSNEKKISVLGLGFSWGRHKWGCFWPTLPGPGRQSNGPIFFLKFFGGN